MEKWVKFGVAGLTLLGFSIYGLVFDQSQIADAAPNFVQARTNGATVRIPSHALQKAPGLYNLGQREYQGKSVQGYMFIDFKPGYMGKPDGKPGGKKPGKSTCFSLLADGAKWKVQEPYIINPINNAGLDPQFVKNNIALNISKWESHGRQIFGNEITGSVDGADTSAPDGKNELFFASISEPGVIGVTIVWGIFNGPKGKRELVEWDQVYDDVDFGWSATGEAGKMDFENIANHELGHALGLGHPDDSCTEETMYRFASYGETKKRSLEAGDIAGVMKLY